MSIKASLTCSIAFQGDGSTTTLVFDLVRTPFVTFDQPSGNVVGAQPPRLNLPPFGAPTGVTSDSATNHGTSVSSISISGTTVTVVFSTAPSGTFQEVLGFYLAF